MIRSLFLVGITISLIALLAGSFTGSMLSTYNLSTDNISYLDTIKNFTEKAEESQNKLNTTTPASTEVGGFDLGGIWTSLTGWFTLPELLSGTINSIATFMDLKASSVSSVVNAIIAIIGVLFLLAIINFVRSGKEL